MTCKDCIHYELCYCEGSNMIDDFVERMCLCFKDKSRFVELPCKVGDTAYRVLGDRRRKHPLECKVDGIWLSEEVSSSVHLAHYIHGVVESSFSVPFSEIGKTIFFNSEEYEKALKGKEEKTI